MTDPIADMLTRIRNAVRAGHPRVDIPLSHAKLAIARILESEGYVGAVSVVPMGKFQAIRVLLRYDGEGNPLIEGLTMVSRPGRRLYAGYRDIPKVLGGVGLSIVSTPRGMLSAQDAKRARVGGEIVCHVW
ncbi:MAG: 30S ribosomal protein S8 [Candidatus Polarisedimenticolia bacterium]